MFHHSTAIKLNVFSGFYYYFLYLQIKIIWKHLKTIILMFFKRRPMEDKAEKPTNVVRYYFTIDNESEIGCVLCKLTVNVTAVN
jgi:hypothetical protein